MATLTGQTVASTYPILLKMTSSPLSTPYNVVESGTGVVSALAVSTLGVKSTGIIESVGNATVGGTLGVTGAATISSTLGVTGAATVGSLSTAGSVTGVNFVSTGNISVTGTVDGRDVSTDGALLDAIDTVIDARTSSATPLTIVSRDASGHFSGATITATSFSGPLTGNVTGNVTGNATGSSGSCTGNSATATALATSRTIELTGAVTGSASFNGTANATISTTLAAQTVPAGSVFQFAAATAPSGYLECNGAAVSRTTYAALFAVTSTVFGVGDGSTTFNLPDLRGEFVRGYDNGRGVDSGRVFGSAQDDMFEAHTHTTTITNANIPSNGSRRVTGSNQDSGDEVFTSSSTGGTETRPRNIALLFCIKT